MEELTHDEGTMMKVAESIRDVVGDESQLITDIVSSMQNAGIKFREVKKS